MKRLDLLLAAALIVAAPAHGAEKGSKPKAEEDHQSAPTVRSIALPGAPSTGVYMDYLACDRARGRVWVPAGNTGSVDVIDTKGDQVKRIEGFPTKETERNGRKRTVGPSSATVGNGVVYVGNRGDSKVCAIDAQSLERSGCVELESMPDGLAYVASTKEVWVTAPRDKLLIILDASHPKMLKKKARIELEGEPEGYAVDDARGVFYTNLEDKDRTLTINVKTRKVARTWMPGCGEDGPKGLALDHARNILMVACSSRVMALDAGHDGKVLSTKEVGEGIDNIDYVEPRHELFAAAGRAAKLAILSLDPAGALTPQATVETAQGARNAVATDDGVAYLTDSPEGKVLVVTRKPAH